jgi:predicted RNase H-like nuclease (RuvC/YqgF family)
LLEQQTEELAELKQSAILHPRITDSQGTDQANVSKPRHTTDQSVHVHVSDPEVAELRAKLKESEETAQRFRAKCSQLVTDKRELQEQKSKWKESSERYRRELDEEKNLTATRMAKHQRELEAQQGKFELLNAAHIKSINSVGTGLDPISDQEFTTKLRDLQDQVLLHL